jgi:sarcosine oxidase
MIAGDRRTRWALRTASRGSLDAAPGRARKYVNPTGGLFIGAPDDYFIADSRKSADATGLEYEMLSREEIERRIPGLRVPDGMIGFLDPGAGVLYPECIVDDQLQAAAALGAEFSFDTEVLEFGPRGDGVFVRSAGGEVEADRLVVTAGAWMPEVLAPLGVTLTVERNTLHWFAEREAAVKRGAGERPVLLVGDKRGEGTAIFPALDGRIKVGAHGSGAFTSPNAVDREIHESEITPVRAMLGRWLPEHAGEYRESAVCLYTNTPDGHFILDRHPVHPQIVLGSPCNGFGFKFSSATGEILAALATDATPPVDPAAWRLSRLLRP